MSGADLWLALFSLLIAIAAIAIAVLEVIWLGKLWEADDR